MHEHRPVPELELFEAVNVQLSHERAEVGMLEILGQHDGREVNGVLDGERLEMVFLAPSDVWLVLLAVHDVEQFHNEPRNLAGFLRQIVK